MQRLRIAAVIVCLWGMPFTAVQGQEKRPPTTGLPEAWGPTDPSRGGEDIIVVTPVEEPGPWLPPEPMPPEEGSLDGASGSGNKSNTAVTYAFFFTHLDNLDRAADKEAALGHEKAAVEWRTHEQSAAGLDAQEARLMKQVAYDCNQLVADKETEIRALMAGFRQQHPNGEFLTLPKPQELYVLWQDRVQIIEQHIDQLRSALGEAGFLKLDSYIRANFAPQVVTPGTGAAKGEQQ